MTSLWLLTNGGSGEDGDEWHLFDIYATEEAANAHVAEENARRGFMELEVEERSVKGSPLTDEERHCLTQVLAINTGACFAPLRSLLDRLGHGAAPENR